MVFESSKNNMVVSLNLDTEFENKKRITYLHLINRKMKLEKDAENYEREYIQLFGDLLENLLEINKECIKYKKIISIYYRMINNGKKFDKNDALVELAVELKPYYDYIEYISMIKNDKGTPISNFQMMEIRKMYKKIVNVLHPDVNPKLFENEGIKDLWNKATVYYKCNNFERLQETYLLIIEELNKLGINLEDTIIIDDLDTKIEKVKVDINNILNTDPYLYRLILEDKKVIEDKKEQLYNEIFDNNEYLMELKQELDILGINIEDFNVV